MEIEDEMSVTLPFPANSDQLVKKLRKFRCHHCPQKFIHKSQLLMHSACHNNNLSKEKNLTDDLPSLKCHICSNVFTRQAALSQHLNSKHKEVEKPFLCSVCQECYKTCQELNIHLGTKHRDQYQLTKNAEYQVLARVKKYQCPHCPKKFYSSSHLIIHSGSHTKQTSFVCSVCGVKYGRAQDIRKHKETCQPKIRDDGQVTTATTSKYLICLVCGYKAPDSSKLENHNRSHTGEKPFQCKACPAKFATNNNLTRHVRMSCPKTKAILIPRDIPSASTTTKSATSTKDAESGHKCRICDQIFKRKKDRSNHEDTHGDKFICQFCPIGFKTQSGLGQHKNRSHLQQIDTLNCSDCGKICVNQKALKAHQVNCPGTVIEVQGGSIKLEIEEHEVNYDIPADPLASLEEEKNPTSFFNTSLNCPICSKGFLSQSDLSWHLNHKHQEVKQPFPSSNLQLKNDQGPIKFVSSPQISKPSFVCDVCGKTYQRAQDIRMHKKKCQVKIHDNGQVSTNAVDSADTTSPLKCHICSKEYKSPAALTYHLGHKHPEVEKPFACSECTESHKTSQELNLHLGTIHSDKFKLEKRTKDLVFAHLKKCQCPHCPERFISASKLNSHLIIHFNESNFICDVCGAKYKQIQTLRNHKAKNNCRPESHNQNNNSSIINECQDVEIEEEIEIKCEIPDHLLLIDGIDQNNINLFVSDSDWVQSDTETADPLNLDSLQ